MNYSTRSIVSLVLSAFALFLVFYTVVLIVAEAQTSQEYIRNYFTDITGPVRFYAVNTTISCFLLWSTALLFLVSLYISERCETAWNVRLFLLSQVLLFAFLGFDDRFSFHEWLGEKLGTVDHYSLIFLAIVEACLIALLGNSFLRRGNAALYLVLAGIGFAVMLLIDAAAPHDAYLRLSIEDLAKTWGTFFFFLFGWDHMAQCVARLQEGGNADLSKE